MSDTTPPRNIIYFSSDANQIPLAGIGTLPYNNPPWDATPDLKVQWYQNVAAITGAQKLMLGALVADTDHDQGYIPLDQMVNNVIVPLKATFGSQFGGVMGWQFALDQAGAWANGIGQALNTNNCTLDATFTV